MENNPNRDLRLRRQDRLHLDERRVIINIGWLRLCVIHWDGRRAQRLTGLEETVEKTAEFGWLASVIYSGTHRSLNEVADEWTERRFEGDRPIPDSPSPTAPFPFVKLPG